MRCEFPQHHDRRSADQDRPQEERVPDDEEDVGIPWIPRWPWWDEDLHVILHSTGGAKDPPMGFTIEAGPLCLQPRAGTDPA